MRLFVRCLSALACHPFLLAAQVMLARHFFELLLSGECLTLVQAIHRVASMSNHPDMPTDVSPNNSTNPILAIFLNKEKELRSGWRVALFFLAFVLVIILINGMTQGVAQIIPSLHFLAAGPLPDAPTAVTAEMLPALLSQVYTILAVLIASAVCAHLLERRTLASVGFIFHRGWFKDFALGSLIGALSLS